MKSILKHAGVTFLLLWGVPWVFGQEVAQPRLETVTLAVGGKRVVAEVADDPAEMTTGMMFREGIGRDEGMLFVMPRIAPARFWMKNTKVPLTIAYIDVGGRILEIHDLEPGNEEPVRSRFPNVAYALEMRQGWFSDNRVLAGDGVTGLPRHPSRR
ncbi:MAG: DUF192 domain-containing protein [Terrimicrobiaceae bacterium]